MQFREGAKPNASSANFPYPTWKRRKSMKYINLICVIVAIVLALAEWTGAHHIAPATAGLLWLAVGIYNLLAFLENLKGG